MSDEVRVKVRGRWITLRKHDIGAGGKEPDDLLPRRYRIPRDLEMPSAVKALGFASVRKVQIRR